MVQQAVIGKGTPFCCDSLGGEDSLKTMAWSVLGFMHAAKPRYKLFLQCLFGMYTEKQTEHHGVDVRRHVDICI